MNLIVSWCVHTSVHLFLFCWFIHTFIHVFILFGSSRLELVFLKSDPFEILTILYNDFLHENVSREHIILLISNF